MKINEVTTDNANILLQDEEILEVFRVIASNEHNHSSTMANTLGGIKDKIKTKARSFESVNEGSKLDAFLGRKSSTEYQAKYDTMVQTWKDAGSPKDAKSIIWFLKSKFKQSDSQINRAFKVAANNNPIVKKMAKDIEAAGVKQEIYDI
jgi:rubrerythrin